MELLDLRRLLHRTVWPVKMAVEVPRHMKPLEKDLAGFSPFALPLKNGVTKSLVFEGHHI